MTCMGIDPGGSGALCKVSNNRYIYISRFSKKSWSAIALIVRIWTQLRKATEHCYFEDNHAMPTDSRSSANTFGRNTGIAEGILIANKVEYYYVEPKVWQFAFNLGGKWAPRGSERRVEQAARKRKHLEIAKLIAETGKYKCDHKLILENCDAVLIALYASFMCYGVPEDLKHLVSPQFYRQTHSP